MIGTSARQPRAAGEQRRRRAAAGLEGVSTRRLAAELPARPMSLYNDIADKDELVGLMLDRVIEEALIGDALSPD